MTYKQKLDEQIAFARKKMREASEWGTIRETDTWNGYLQGLKYALATSEGYGYPAEPSVKKIQPEEYLAVRGLADGKDELDKKVGETLLTKMCQCSPTDLQPHGECICGQGDKVAPV